MIEPVFGLDPSAKCGIGTEYLIIKMSRFISLV